MNRKARNAERRRLQRAAQFGTLPTTEETSAKLLAALAREPLASDACESHPGAWQPPTNPNVDEPIACDDGTVSEEESETVTRIVEATEPVESIETPFLIGMAERMELGEPLLLEHGPDPDPDPKTEPELEEDDPFEELIALSDMLSDEATKHAKVVGRETDPDLRAILAASYETHLVDAMALGDEDAALEAFENHGAVLRQSAANLRKRLATPPPMQELTAEQQRDVTRAHLRRIVVSLTEEALTLDASATGLETLAVDVGNGYRRACEAFNGLTDRLAASWTNLNVAVVLHQAAKPDARPDAIAALRTMASRVFSDEDLILAALEARHAAEERVGEMHRAWSAGRARALEIRKRLLQVRSTCVLFDLPEDAFGEAIDAGTRTCQKAVEAMDAHKTLVSIQPTSFPRSVTQVRDAIPHIREILERAGRRGENELGQLMLIAYHLVDSTRSRGRTPKVVARILEHAGLLRAEEAERAKETVKDEYPRLFSRTQKGKFWLYKPNALGNQAGKQFLDSHPDAEDVRTKLLASAEAVREEQVETRKSFVERVKSKSATP